jgi:hypothetical protein
LEVLFLVDRGSDGRRSLSRSTLADTAESNDDAPVLIGLRALPAGISATAMAGKN